MSETAQGKERIRIKMINLIYGGLSLSEQLEAREDKDGPILAIFGLKDYQFRPIFALQMFCLQEGAPLDPASFLVDLEPLITELSKAVKAEAELEEIQQRLVQVCRDGFPIEGADEEDRMIEALSLMEAISKADDKLDVLQAAQRLTMLHAKHLCAIHYALSPVGNVDTKQIAEALHDVNGLKVFRNILISLSAFLRLGLTGEIDTRKMLQEGIEMIEKSHLS